MIKSSNGLKLTRILLIRANNSHKLAFSCECVAVNHSGAMDFLLNAILFIALNPLHRVSGLVVYNPKNPIRRESLQGKVQAEEEEKRWHRAQSTRHTHFNESEFLGPGEIPLEQVRDLESFLLGAQFGQKFKSRSLGNLPNNLKGSEHKDKNALRHRGYGGSTSTSRTPDPNPWKTARVIPYQGPRAPMPPSGTLKVVPYPFTTTPEPRKRGPTLILETSIVTSVTPTNTSAMPQWFHSNETDEQSVPLLTQKLEHVDTPEYYDQFDTLPPNESDNLNDLSFLPKLSNISNLTLSQLEDGNLTLNDFLAWEQEVASGVGESLQFLPELAFNVSVPPVTVIVDQTPFHVSGDDWSGLANSNISIVPVVINAGRNHTDLTQPLELGGRSNLTKQFEDDSLFPKSSEDNIVLPISVPSSGNATQ
eukprot:TCALIF_13339-PA protein Name:"Protein of unknown function" AED:0.00 eAED:0.00 QI:1/1/1/1/0.75/0.8/5/4/420